VWQIKLPHMWWQKTPSGNSGIRELLWRSWMHLKALVFLYPFEESVDCHLLSSFCDGSYLHISLFKYVLSTMGVSKESISKFLIGNWFHVKLRILSPESSCLLPLQHPQSCLLPPQHLKRTRGRFKCIPQRLTARTWLTIFLYRCCSFHQKLVFS